MEVKKIIKVSNWDELDGLIISLNEESQKNSEEELEEGIHKEYWVFEDKIIELHFDIDINYSSYVKEHRKDIAKLYDRYLSLLETLIDFIPFPSVNRYIVFYNKLDFSNVIFENKFYLESLQFYNEVNFYNCTFNEHVSFDYTFYKGKFNISSSDFLMWCSIAGAIFCDDCNISHNVFSSYLELSFSCYTKKLDLSYSKFGDEIVLTNSYFKYFEVNNISGFNWWKYSLLIRMVDWFLDLMKDFSSRVKFNRKNMNLIIANVKDINLLLLEWWDWWENTYMKNIILDNFSTVNDSKDIYYFNGLNIEYFFINDSRFLSQNCWMRNNNIKILSIINTNFWESIFNGVSIKSLFLKHITLNKCIFNWMTFPYNYVLEEKTKHGLSEVYIKNTYREMKDIYRQLKSIMDINWNKTEANRFYGLELSYELRSLESRKVYNSWRDLFTFEYYVNSSHLLWDKIVLKSWKIFSNFWNNWLSALLWLLLLAFLGTNIKFLYHSMIDIKIPALSFMNDGIYSLVDAIYLFGVLLWVSIVILIWCFLMKGIAKIINKNTLLLILFLMLILFLFYDKSLIDEFLNLLYPLYGFWEKYNNALELLGFILYKVLYAVIGWHLVIALKRLTKR